MREDIAKVIVTRPRVGGDDGYQLRRGRRQSKDSMLWDNLPKKEGMRSVNIRNYNGKYLSDFLAPIQGFLKKNVGRPWDKVNSEIRKNLKMTSTTQRHVLDHIYNQYVTLKPLFDSDGNPSAPGRWGSTLRDGEYYVDMKGILRRYKAPKSPRKPKEPVKFVPLDDTHCYEFRKGSWFEGTLKVPAQDELERELGSKFHRRMIPQPVWVYRQLSSKEIKRLGLPKISL